jgi:DNA (cytosine-5)-methyltransferase 1
MTIMFGSLFAGIGGFDLGLERAGMKCAWQVELGDYATRILENHWPHVTRHRDVRECGQHNLEPVDLICGGFPCQPHSFAGMRKGSDDERDLWEEFARIIRELEPRWVLAENVPGILSTESGRYFGRILRDLAALGYDVEWECIPASVVGAPHRRERIWIFATKRMVPDADRFGCQGSLYREVQRFAEMSRQPAGGASQWADGWPVSAPKICGVADGIPDRIHQLTCLGNAVVPQVVEVIGKAIMKEAHHER